MYYISLQYSKVATYYTYMGSIGLYLVHLHMILILLHPKLLKDINMHHRFSSINFSITKVPPFGMFYGFL